MWVDRVLKRSADKAMSDPTLVGPLLGDAVSIPFLGASIAPWREHSPWLVRSGAMSKSPSRDRSNFAGANTDLESFQCLYHSTQLRRVKVSPQLDAPALGQYHRHCAWTFTIRCAAPTSYFDSHQPFAIALDIAGPGSFSLKSSLQRAQRHSVDSAELAS
jgi:hypothetical protein